MKWFTLKERIPKRGKIFVYITQEGEFLLGIYGEEGEFFITNSQIALWAYIPFPKKHIEPLHLISYRNALPEKSDSEKPYMLTEQELKELEEGKSWRKSYEKRLDFENEWRLQKKDIK